MRSLTTRRHGATVIEMAPVDLSALDGLRAQALWRYVGETGPETPSRLNFSYTVRAVTTRIRAAEVIVTPIISSLYPAAAR